MKKWNKKAGYTLATNYFKVGEHYINLVLAEDNSYLQFLEDLANFIKNTYPNLDLSLIDEQDEVENLNPEIRHVTGRKNAIDVMDELYKLILTRNNEYKDSIEQGRKCEEFAPKLYIVNSVRTLFENKDQQSIEKLDLALERGNKNYNVYFIIFDEAKKISGTSKMKWYKENVKTDNGIWIGRGFANQFVFTPSNNTGEIRKDIVDHNFAIAIEKSNAKIIKILNTKEEQLDE